MRNQKLSNNLMFSCLSSKRINLIFCILLCNPSLFSAWHDHKAEGWAWYEDTKKLEKVETQPEKPPSNSTGEIEKIRKSLEEKLATALLEPTPENIKSYMEEQQKWVERSSQFAQVWAQVLLNHPHLDYTATHIPVSQYGLQSYKKSLQEEKEKLISSLANEYGLFFFYEGKKESSATLGRIVQGFSKKYGWKTVGISVDGEEIGGFSNKVNNGIAEALGVDLLPALYLINPKKDIARPIAFGLVAMDQIENNIVLQFKEINND